MNLRRLGGFASIATVLLAVYALLHIFLLSPRTGLSVQNNWNDPVKVMAAHISSPKTFLLYNINLMLWGICFVPIGLALRCRIENDTFGLMSIALIGTSVASTLQLAAGTIGIVGLPPIVSAQDISGFGALTSVAFSMACAGDFAFGWVILLSGWAGFKSEKLPRFLSLLLMIEGLLIIGEIALIVLGLTALILILINHLWLGIVFLRDSGDTQKRLRLG
jgi:hypothetical protein